MVLKLSPPILVDLLTVEGQHEAHEAEEERQTEHGPCVVGSGWWEGRNDGEMGEGKGGGGEIKG